MISKEREPPFSRLVDTRQTGWEHLGQMDNGTWWQAEATLLHAVHDTVHHLVDVGEGLERIRRRQAGEESFSSAALGS